MQKLLTVPRAPVLVGAPPRRGAPRIYLPDLAHAHGAWVYLAVSLGAGALLGSRGGMLSPLVSGTAFAGAYLCATALLSGRRRAPLRALGGAALTFASCALGLLLGASPEFTLVLPPAALLAATSFVLARRHGVLAARTILFGIPAIACAAPAAALAGGAARPDALVLFLALTPFFWWRTLRLATILRATHPWDRDELRRTGLREAGLAVLWAAVALAFVG